MNLQTRGRECKHSAECPPLWCSPGVRGYHAASSPSWTSAPRSPPSRHTPVLPTTQGLRASWTSLPYRSRTGRIEDLAAYRKSEPDLPSSLSIKPCSRKTMSMLWLLMDLRWIFQDDFINTGYYIRYCSGTKKYNSTWYSNRDRR